MTKRCLAWSVACTLLASSLSAAEGTLQKLVVAPGEIALSSAKDRQLVVVQAVYSDGITRDVAKDATLTVANSALVRRDGLTFYPVADGQTELKVEFGGQSHTIPIKVERAAETRPVSFKLFSSSSRDRSRWKW